MSGLKTASYWKYNNGKVKCFLCPHHCQLKDGEEGICRTRKNIHHQLHTLAWNNLSAINIDPVEKKPLFHFYPGHKTLSIATNGCNLRCLNCQNQHISQCAPDKLNSKSIDAAEIINLAKKHAVKSISYTYTEPVVFYEFMLEIANKAAEKSLYNIMVSSGFINPKPLKQLLSLIDAVNIDLKAFDDDVYQKLCGVNLNPILKTLEIIRKSNTWMEITCLIIPGISDQTEHINKMCKWLYENGFENTPIHFSRFFPTHQLNKTPITPDETLYKIVSIAASYNLKYIYIGNLQNNSFENTYCHKCGNILISRNGNLLTINTLLLNQCNKCKEIIPGKF